MFFHLIVSSCISHNFNCPFLEPVTFATRATLAVLHLIVTLISFYFVCLLRLYLAQIKLFSFIWIFFYLTVLSFDCYVCILRNFSYPLIWLLHSNLAQLKLSVLFDCCVCIFRNYSCPSIWLLRLHLAHLNIDVLPLWLLRLHPTQIQMFLYLVVTFVSRAKLTVLSFNYFVRISYYFSCPFISSLLKFPSILFVSLISRANLTFLSFWLFCLHPAQI